MGAQTVEMDRPSKEGSRASAGACGGPASRSGSSTFGSVMVKLDSALGLRKA